MRVWVTGAGGQVGQILMKKFQEKGIDCFGSSHAEADIADEEAVRRSIRGVTHIINTAAYCDVDPAETEREKAYHANVAGPSVLAKISREKEVRLVHISTDYVFDGTLNRYYREEDETHPLNWYGETKRQGERRVLEENPEACIVRASWVFGGGGKKNYAAKILEAIQKQKELRFVDDQKSCPTYAPDLADALILLLGHSGLYHYCNDGSISKHAFAVAIWERANARGFPVLCERIVPISSAEFFAVAKRPLFTPLNTEKIRSLAKVRSWQEALDDFFEHVEPAVYDFQ